MLSRRPPSDLSRLSCISHARRFDNQLPAHEARPTSSATLFWCCVFVCLDADSWIYRQQREARRRGIRIPEWLLYVEPPSISRDGLTPPPRSPCVAKIQEENYLPVPSTDIYEYNSVVPSRESIRKWRIAVAGMKTLAIPRQREIDCCTNSSLWRSKASKRM